MSSIEITRQPTYTTYTVGETFDTTGMQVTAHYVGGSSAVVTGYTYEPSGALELTDDTVVVSYGGKTANVSIEVLNNDTSINSVKVDGVDAVKNEDDDWNVTLPAGTTSVSNIVVTPNDEECELTIVPDHFDTIESSASSSITVVSPSGVHNTYHLAITVAEE